MKKQFIEHKFKKPSLDLIDKANEILLEYNQQGLVLSLRQLYYQFVARDLLSNKQAEYDRLGALISKARLAGLVDWDMMEDRTRFTRQTQAWTSPEEILRAVSSQYKEDLWRNQPYRPEVWIEKDALVGVIESACTDLRVRYFACRGYSSQSAQYEAGCRFARYLENGQTPMILHLGDHDPSGIDMTRDNEERTSLFAGHKIIVKRLALNIEQVKKYDPPPNPAKETDSRADGYIKLYGESSWELDALEPSVIDQLIRDSIEEVIDSDLWEEASEKEATQRKSLEDLSKNWGEVRDHIGLITAAQKAQQTLTKGKKK